MSNVGDLAKAVRNRSDMHFGLYHSMYEWFHPLYLEDKANNFRTTTFVQVDCMCFSQYLRYRYVNSVIVHLKLHVRYICLLLWINSLYAAYEWYHVY